MFFCVDALTLFLLIAGLFFCLLPLAELGDFPCTGSSAFFLELVLGNPVFFFLFPLSTLSILALLTELIDSLSVSLGALVPLCFFAGSSSIILECQFLIFFFTLLTNSSKMFLEVSLLLFMRGFDESLLSQKLLGFESFLLGALRCKIFTSLGQPLSLSLVCFANLSVLALVLFLLFGLFLGSEVSYLLGPDAAAFFLGLLLGDAVLFFSRPLFALFGFALDTQC